MKNKKIIINKINNNFIRLLRNNLNLKQLIKDFCENEFLKENLKEISDNFLKKIKKLK